MTATRSNDGSAASVSWTAYAGENFQYYRVIVCTDAQYDGSSCSGTVYKSDAIHDANSTGPITVTGLSAQTGYGVILQVWRGGSALKIHATLPAVPPVGPNAPANLSVTAGDGYLDIAWDAVSGATGYDVRAKKAGSTSWHSVASNISATSHRYTTTETIDYVAVRARNANGAGNWTELSRAPSNDWLNVVIQGGASAQSANAQSQLAAPASITVTRDNNPRDEKLRVSWAAVNGAGGYNLACASRPPNNTPFSSVSWWHCGSVDSGSTTSFIVDEDRGPGEPTDLNRKRSYTVAVRAVTTDPAQASPWLVSDDAHPAFAPDYRFISVSRVAGSVSLSWTQLTHGQGYEIECATRENDVTGAYTLCADIETATVTNGKIKATISSWSASGTDYTIDDTKIYDLWVRTTNAWGKSEFAPAPLIHPYMVSNLGSTKHQTLSSNIHSDLKQAVAFTTGPTYGGYVLKNITVPLKDSGARNDAVLTLTLHAMEGSGDYSSTSQPSDTVLATLSGTAPTTATWTDTTYTCSSSGCNLSADTTYFVVASSTETGPAYEWAIAATETETKLPSGNGWDIHVGHSKQKAAADWRAWNEWNLAEIVFAIAPPTLTPSNLTGTGATLTLAGHSGNWYYKYTSPSGGTCSTNAVSGSSTTVTMGAGSYTFAAYSDASCSNLLATTIAFSKDATPAAPASVTAAGVAGDNGEKYLSGSWKEPLWASKYHVTYTCNGGSDWGLIANGTVESQANLTQTGQTVTARRDLAVENGWWDNNQSPQCRMAVRAGNHNDWSSWVNSNSVGPPSP